MCHSLLIYQLIEAAEAVLRQTQNGELFMECEPFLARNTAAMNALELAVNKARTEVQLLRKQA